MNIYLVCNVGMSTSVLVKRMRQAAETIELEAKIEAYSVEVLEKVKDEADVILIGPQIRHMSKEITKIVDGSCPVETISMRDYGMINGKNVLAQALAVINK
ncbi:PTS system, cellobiose-specific IIB component [Clostridium acidisoli DSM 12555]|uniref:PTS system, cellobiose-specific IIB component n=1 Tax=Clostridium acidisoli DSM 12555 TaxID=1121291 RepID=A0A1W1XLF4_9CLOT|nr:PTS sugar transporter subunit IIB [Clostridium acidisoli]SMC24682.1 PTS system, cellobiose-specific IIB component [Clostridium acidisoli DSM 12555]